ncbi:MAG: radical SAM/SPASM domain-containing protein [Sarcina sp.]
MTVSNYKILKKVFKNIEDFKKNIETGEGFAPIDVEIRVNWKCNAKCKMCGLYDYMKNNTKERKNEMSYENIIKLLDELYEMGCNSVTFSGGEPTLKKDMKRIINYAKYKCKMNVAINTNGYLLDKNRVEQYIEAGVNSFTFSILSPNHKINDEIMGLKNGLKHAEKAIDYINEYNHRLSEKINIYVNTVVLRSNIDSFSDFGKFFEKHKVNHLNFTPASISTEWDEWTSNNEVLRPTLDQILNFKNNILLQLRKNICGLQIEEHFGETHDEIIKNLKVEFSNNSQYCYVPWVHTVIQSNGDIIPCCYAPDDFIIGNVLKNSFSDIWRGEDYKNLRKNSLKNRWNMCISCRQYKTLNENIEKKIGVKKRYE